MSIIGRCYYHFYFYFNEAIGKWKLGKIIDFQLFEIKFFLLEIFCLKKTTRGYFEFPSGDNFHNFPLVSKLCKAFFQKQTLYKTVRYNLCQTPPPPPPTNLGFFPFSHWSIGLSYSSIWTFHTQNLAPNGFGVKIWLN